MSPVLQCNCLNTNKTAKGASTTQKNRGRSDSAVAASLTAAAPAGPVVAAVGAQPRLSHIMGQLLSSSR